MGTDIHLYVERRPSNHALWSVVPPPARDLTIWPRKSDAEGDGDWESWGPHECMTTSKCYGASGDGDCSGASCKARVGTGRDMQWYRNRNYDVFAILADVRNGYAFAGCDTGDGFRPIAPQRGMPSDVTSYVREYHTWDHSPSWLMLAEILAFNWKQTSIHRGVIPFRADDARRFGHDGERDNFETWDARGGGVPKSYSGGVSGRDVVTINASKARELIAKPALIPSQKQVYVTVSWQETYAESAEDFLAFVETFLQPLGDPHNVRIVFGFDS